jgi:hypothetical protein
MDVVKSRKVESISEESKELAQMMEAQPQAEQKKAYYEGVMVANAELHNELQERVKRSFTTSISLVLGFIPIITFKRLDKGDKARLKVEIQELENVVYNQQQYYEHWLKQAKAYESKMDEVTRDCNQNFDAVLKKAKELKHNPRLQEAIANYKNEDNKQQLKNEYFLYLKQAVNNAEVHKSKGKGGRK